METTNQGTHVDKEKLYRDIQEVIRDAEALIHETAGDLSEKARATRERLTARITEARAQLREWNGVLKEKAIAGAKQADQTIRAHPYESIAISFGVGLLAGLLISRK
ncbi:MAG: DUF883 family protein [Verrucomicrobium sp.]|nr:DUF883 family protein [Verrucomicrobium sp.]